MSLDDLEKHTSLDDLEKHASLDDLEKQCRALNDLENYCGDDKDEKREELAFEILHAIDPLMDSEPDRGRAMCIQGFALSWIGEKAEAEDLLTRAVKLDPTLELAWVRLGEMCCEQGDGVQAQVYFEEALEHVGKTPLLLRNLSITLRALPENRAVNFAEALQHAKDAVAADPADAASWETLGNAYFGDFFLQPCPDPDILKRVLSAYNKAEELYNMGNGTGPLLLRNRAVVYKYMENYGLAIDDFRQALALGGLEFKACGEEAETIRGMVRRISNQCSSKGRIKMHKLQSMVQNVESSSSTLSDLKSDEDNSASLGCNVFSVLTRCGEVPLKVICHDRTGNFFCLSIYNCDFARAVALLRAGESLIIARPYLRQVVVGDFSYTCVRCAHPGDVTLRGTGPLSHIAAVSQFTQGMVGVN